MKKSLNHEISKKKPAKKFFYKKIFIITISISTGLYFKKINLIFLLKRGWVNNQLEQMNTATLEIMGQY